jgi:hypothetical protein
MIRSTITYHIKNIFSNEELDKNTSVEKFDGRVELDNSTTEKSSVVQIEGKR